MRLRSLNHKLGQINGIPCDLLLFLKHLGREGSYRGFFLLLGGDSFRDVAYRNSLTLSCLLKTNGEVIAQFLKIHRTITVILAMRIKDDPLNLFN